MAKVKKATAAYVKVKEQLLIKNGLLYCKTLQGQADEIVFKFVVPERHRSTALDGCHQEVAHQGQRCSTALTSEEVAKQRRYYDCKAGVVALQPGDIVMVCTDGFVGKQKVKDRWEDGGFIIESQLED